jgi:hypothetical protein
MGATARLPDDLLDPFAEAPGRAFVVSGPESVFSAGLGPVPGPAGGSGSVPGPAGLRVIGRVGGEDLELQGLLKIAVSELRTVHEHGLVEFL